MSTTQKKTVELPVETVENLRKLLDWIPTTIDFWKKREEFPFNLICDCCEDIAFDLAQDIKKSFFDDEEETHLYIPENVSLSHIIDK